MVRWERKVARLAAESRLKHTALFNAIRVRVSNAETSMHQSSGDLASAVRRQADRTGMNLARLRERLQAINPSAVLERGYTLVMRPDGKILTRKSQAVGIPEMKIRFSDGEIEVEHHG